MKFRTHIEPEEISPQIEYGDHVVCLGSCFAEEMGNRLADIRISVDVNPAGILYNPVSISRAIEGAYRNGELQEDHLVFHDGLWHSFMHHGAFSAPEKKAVIEQIKAANALVANGIRKAKWLILTLGSARVFRHLEKDIIVANCHKIPGSEFQRERLSVEACFQELSRIIQMAKEMNPDIKVLCTVSPVRHVRDGLHENQLSKATLLLAIDKACVRFGHVSYFPSYEICMDDLRDYRFYGNDLIHPSDLAVDYIWEKFSASVLSGPTRSLSAEVLKVRKAMRHRFMHGQKQKVTRFAEKQLEKIRELSARLPQGALDTELEYFTDLLSSD